MVVVVCDEGEPGTEYLLGEDSHDWRCYRHHGRATTEQAGRETWTPGQARREEWEKYLGNNVIIVIRSLLTPVSSRSLTEYIHRCFYEIKI